MKKAFTHKPYNIRKELEAAVDQAQKEPIPGPIEPPDPDPWKHRHENLRCVTCMWWLRKGGSQVGRCRRNAPTFNGWPVVFENDWCGEHRLDETRI